jgi:acyl-CoA synthetase (AMP-forming)/AMP-acid ligase II
MSLIRHVGGENIWPIEIEERLMQHPSVSEASVVGVKDHPSSWGGCGMFLESHQKSLQAFRHGGPTVDFAENGSPQSTPICILAGRSLASASVAPAV